MRLSPCSLLRVLVLYSLCVAQCSSRSFMQIDREALQRAGFPVVTTQRNVSSGDVSHANNLNQYRNNRNKQNRNNERFPRTSGGVDARAQRQATMQGQQSDSPHAAMGAKTPSSRNPGTALRASARAARQRQNSRASASSSSSSAAAAATVSLKDQQHFRIELIKQEILTKLGRRQPPHVRVRNSSIPRDVVSRALQRLDLRQVKRFPGDAGYDEVDISEIISFSENAVNTSNKEALRFTIEANRQRSAFQVTGADIYVLARYRRKRKAGSTGRRASGSGKRKRHRNPSRRLIIKVFHADERTGREVVVTSTQLTIRHTRWIKVPVPVSLIQNVFDTGGRSLQMRLVCTSCGRDVSLVLVRKSRQSKRDSYGASLRKRRNLKMNKRRPYMVIKTKMVTVPAKKRRATECDINRNACCKRSIEVRFSDIGWDDWIIAPEAYIANYCDGKCFRQSSNSYSSHRTVLDVYLKSNPGFSLNMCCSPRRWSSLSMLFYDENQNIIQKNLNKMIVEECGCS